MTPMAIAGLVLAGLATAAGGVTAGLVVTTSGPFANGGNEAAPSATAAVSPMAGTPTPQIPLDADGWPIVTCSAGLQAFKSDTRKISACGPTGFRFLNDEQDGTNGRPKDVIELLIEWRNVNADWEYMSVQIVEKSDKYTRANWQEPCKQKTPTTLLGLPAEQCIVTQQDLNGSSLYTLDTWGVQQFAETPNYWVIADAAGPQPGADRDVALGRALQVFRSFEANGLDRVK